MVIFKDFCNAEKTNKNKHSVEVILTTFLRHGPNSLGLCFFIFLFHKSTLDFRLNFK